MLPPHLEVTLGPCPCQECHLPLYFVSGRWTELHYRPILSRNRRTVPRGTVVGHVREYPPHVCPARLDRNPVVHVIPKGRQGRGGHWRALVGLPRTRRAPKGRPELA